MSSPLLCSIVLADDHAMVRSALRALLEEHQGLRVLAEAGDGEELLALLERLTPDLVVLDLSMPRLGGLEAIRRVKARRPRVKILVLTVHYERDCLNRAISDGADGYLLKSESLGELIQAVHTLRAGKTYLSPALLEDVTTQWAEFCRKAASSPSKDRLSLRERDVLRLVAEGKTSGEIAQALCLSVRTVERHRAHIMAKLKVRNSAALVRCALTKGYAS